MEWKRREAGTHILHQGSDSLWVGWPRSLPFSLLRRRHPNPHNLHPLPRGQWLRGTEAWSQTHRGLPTCLRLCDSRCGASGGPRLSRWKCVPAVSSLVPSGFWHLSEETLHGNMTSSRGFSYSNYCFQDPLWVPGLSPVSPGAKSLGGWAAIITLSVSNIQMNTFF